MMVEQRYQALRNITLLGALINFILGVAKLISGVFGNSHALVADGIHSFADLFTDFLVLLASKFASKDADVSHPYGHQRIETASTVFLSLLLIITGLGICYDGIINFISRDKTVPDLFVLWIVIISIILNEVLFYLTKIVGEKFSSELLIANAWHHRSDALSSFIVLIGVVGSLMGVVGFDSLAAVIVGVIIVHMGWKLGWKSILELIDTGVEPEVLSKIKSIIEEVPGAIAIHQLRTRSMGGAIYVDVHVLVSSELSVSEGHYIAQHVHLSLINNIENLTDVTVHIDPEDDEIAKPCINLPSREYVLLEIKRLLPKESAIFDKIILHYLNGGIICELYLGGDKSVEVDRVKEVLSSLDFIKSTNLYRQELDGFIS